MQQIYFGVIKEEEDISLYFYNQPTAFASRNPVIIPIDGKALRFANLAELAATPGLGCAGSGMTQQSFKRIAGP